MKQFKFLIALMCGCLISCSENEPSTPQPYAYFGVGQGEDSFTIVFNNTSKNASTFNWDFGDGTGSDEESPTHTYSENGVFEVSLTATNEKGENDMRTIPVTIAAPMAEFSYELDGLSVYFKDESLNHSSVAWDFGDGNTSVDDDPTHTYDENGTYTVQLTVSNNMNETDSYVAELVLEAPVAAFSYTVDQFTVTFTNESENAATSTWDFGDGSETVSEENPSHLFEMAGTYTVGLFITSENDVVDEIEMDVLVTGIERCIADEMSTGWVDGRDWKLTFDRFPINAEVGSRIESTVQPNPDFNNIHNTSCSVNKVVRPDRDPFYGLLIYYSDLFSGELVPMDWSTNKILEMNVFFESAGTFEVIVTGSIPEANITNTLEVGESDLDKWIKLSYDLSADIDDRGTYTGLELKFNDELPDGWTFYFDNVAQVSGD